MTKFTFYCQNREDYDTMENIANKAIERNYDVDFQNDFSVAAEIGFYCQHFPKPDHCQFSVVMLHDMGQGNWPGTISYEALTSWVDSDWGGFSDWSTFDIGLLPGPLWSRHWARFQTSPNRHRSQPKRGIFEIGYPKSDHAFDVHGRLSDDFMRHALQTFKLNARPSNILFAPSWETNDFGHFKSFLSSVADIDANLLIKYAPHYAPGLAVPDDPRIILIDSETNILDCIAAANVVVSEESNVLVEALLFGLPTIAVTDWNVPANLDYDLPARPPEPPAFAFLTPRSTLGDSIRHVLGSQSFFRAEAQIARDQWFSNLGRSSSLVIDLVEAGLNGSPFPMKPLGAIDAR